MQDTLILAKPDAVQRGLVGEIIGRFERKGLKLRALKLLQVDGALAARHYAVHHGKPFYDGLIRFITAGPVVAMVWSGPEAIKITRAMVGATSPLDAHPGTIRGDFSTITCYNLIHASDAPETAEAEIRNFFTKDELLDWEPRIAPWLGHAK